MPPEPRPPSPLSARIAIAVILLLGAAGSIWGFYDARERNLQRAEDEFNRRSAILHSLTSGIIGSYEDALFDLHLTFSVEQGMTREAFAHAARSLAERNPGVKAFEWIPVVPRADRAAFEAAHSPGPGGRPFEITERNSTGGMRRAGDRDEYYPITYVEPLAGNEPALGYDLKTGPAQTELARSRQTHQVSLTGQITLVQEQDDRRGVVMIWPVFRPGAAPGTPGVFLGFVEAVFRVHDMLESTRTRTWNPESFLDMLFVDDDETDPARRILYYRPSAGQHLGPAAPTEQDFRRGLHDEHPLMVGGRNWKILYRPRAGWLQDQITPLPVVRSIGVLSITFLLSGLVFIIGRRSAVISREVTERTAELNESRRLLDSLLHALPGMAYRCLYDKQLKVIYVSEGALALTGYPADDFIWGKVHFRQLIHPDDIERVRAATLAGLQSRSDIDVEYRLVARDRTEKWVLSRGRGVYDQGGKLLFLEGLAIDVTSRKQAEADKFSLERKLLEGQKLESLGLLAGGIAHDFNNILTGILGNANLARFKLKDDSPILPHLNKIELGTARAAELCQQMLAYSGKSTFVVGAVDLSQLVQDTLPLLHTTIASRARLELHLSPRPVVVMADATQLRQIVMNLALNAADAVAERTGEVHVTTGIRAFGADFLRTASDGDTLAPGEYAFIEVRDNGCGMSPETLSRIFDPFFTTKFAGRGLGLAAVRGIVRGHHGALHVASTPGQGSTFTLILPPTSATVSTPPMGVPETRQYSGRALVIDDEEEVREAASGLLTTLGFTVSTAGNGSDGVAQFCLAPGDFKLVLLDLTMPGLNGEETLAALRAIAPEVRVLLMSGYSENARAARLAGVGPVRFLQKPFTREALERRLRDLLH